MHRYRGILSQYPTWYANYQMVSWEEMYNNEPYENIDDVKQQSLIIGGEVCVWGEHVDPSNVFTTLWPRGAGVAERLWSQQSVTDNEDFEKRLHRFRCHLIDHGVPSGVVHKQPRNKEFDVDDPESCYAH